MPTCKYFTSGRGCAKGDGCPFGHGDADPRPKAICRFVLSSEGCKRENCSYFHDEPPICMKCNSNRTHIDANNSFCNQTTCEVCCMVPGCRAAPSDKRRREDDEGPWAKRNRVDPSAFAPPMHSAYQMPYDPYQAAAQPSAYPPPAQAYGGAPMRGPAYGQPYAW